MRPTKTNRLRICQIVDVVDETPTTKTLKFRDKEVGRSKPGQFLMIWIPGVDEVPMSVSQVSKGGPSAITVKKVGEATAKLHEMKRGDQIGVRGPYGNSFTVKTGTSLLVGGGTGIAPLTVLAERLVERRQRIYFVAGAKTGRELLFQARLKKFLRKDSLLLTTDDGSLGEKGLASDLAVKILQEKKIKNIYVCGPEAMMARIFREAEKLGIEVQASLERYMKCGIGLCGQCVLDPIGALVCHDGPVFTTRDLRMITDFGRYKREADGRKLPIA